MTRAAIVGGALQGLEAAYLALKAGMEAVVIDKRDDVLAKNICSYFLCTDVLKKDQKLIDELKKADFIIPALENGEALRVLNELAKEHGLILAFDLEAYNISSSKILSDRMIQGNDIPSPKYYPNCEAPYIAKPSSSSGSDSVNYFDNTSSLENFLKDIPRDEGWVVQEYLWGRSYSLEVIGMPGSYRTYEVTEIIVDENYDCKRVYGPCGISPEIKAQFIETALKLANAINLKGIMDVEVIDDHGTLKVLEIDARIPSQTPTVVYHSSGINLVEELRDIFIYNKFKAQDKSMKSHVSYEHLLIGEGQIRILGEHIMVNAGPLYHKFGFCEAHEVLTNYTPGAKSWKGTFINIADSREDLEEKRNNMFKKIELLQGEGELELIDLSPSI